MNAATVPATAAASQTEPLSPDEYALFVKQLLGEGTMYGKTKDVAAYKLHNLEVVTENRAGEIEVKKTVEFKEQLYLVFDTAFWPTDYARQLAVKDMAQKWAKRIIGESDLNDPDFRGPGMWTVRSSNFEFDYLKKDDAADMYMPNPDACRLCMPVKHDIFIPTGWGEPFLVPAGGTLVVRERDVPVLAEAVQKILDGASPEDVLLKKNAKGNTVAIFDIYGMMPGFLEGNYGSVTAKPETEKLFKFMRPILNGEGSEEARAALAQEIERRTTLARLEKELKSLTQETHKNGAFKYNMPTLALIGAIDSTDLEGVKAAVEAGANVNALIDCDRYDQTVLEKAGWSREISGYLKERGAMTKAAIAIRKEDLSDQIRTLTAPTLASAAAEITQTAPGAERDDTSLVQDGPKNDNTLS